MMEIFDRKEIELNKQGKKSEKQIKEIKQMMNPGMWMYVGLGILVAGGCFSTVLGGSGMAFLGIILGLSGLLAAGMGFKKWNQRRVLLAEKIQTASGRVFFKDGAYVAETSAGKKISHLGSSGAEVPPGKYTFYFLDSHNWLLAADPRDSEEEMKNSVNQILAKTFEYNMEYLESTRKDAQEGIIKSAQGIPELSFFMESVPKVSEDDIDETITHTYYTIGGFKFEVPQSSYILSKFPHRVYYLEDKLQAIEII
jgi:hypothetical protein